LVEEAGAKAVANEARNFLAEKQVGCKAFVSRCRNRGAEITVSGL
jgi:predicted sugar kinase